MNRFVNLNALGWILATASLVTVLVMEHVFYLEPCPLCIIQRVIVLTIGMFFLVRWLIEREGRITRICAVGAVLFSLLGIFVAARHVWIQYLPPEELPGCLPGLTYLFDTFPILVTLEKVYMGSVECAEVQWRFMGLSIPEQSLVLFMLFLIISIKAVVSGGRDDGLAPDPTEVILP